MELEKAHFQAVSENYLDAIQLYSQYISKNYRAEAYLGRALCYMQIGKYPDAIADFDKSQGVYTKEALLYRGQAKYYLGFLQGAISDFSELQADCSIEIASLANQWATKCKYELEMRKFPKNENEQTEDSFCPPPKYVWYQNSADVVLKIDTPNVQQNQLIINIKKNYVKN